VTEVAKIESIGTPVGTAAERLLSKLAILRVFALLVDFEDLYIKLFEKAFKVIKYVTSYAN